ncbi:MAG: peroxidase family protein [Pseudomonadota bacterium]
MPCHHGTAAMNAASRHAASITDRRIGLLFDQVAPVADPAATLAEMDALARSMEDTAGAGPASAGMTYFGQFLDHDVTLDATSALGELANVDAVVNQRTPTLDLDCVFGGGPEASPLLYASGSPHYLLFGTHANDQDLARNPDGVAAIGDPRNDENAVVAAIQGQFIKLYNLLLHDIVELGTGEFQEAGESPSAAAIRLTRWHYQRIILEDFLPAFVDEGVLSDVMSSLRATGRPHAKWPEKAPYMPAEFTVAAYRFGHGTALTEFDIGGGAKRSLFGTSSALPALEAFGPKDLRIDLKLFFNTPEAPTRAQKARPVGPTLDGDLLSLPFVDGGLPADPATGRPAFTEAQAKSLALRNLVRDRLGFRLICGEALSRHWFGDAIPRNAATQGLSHVPLWYYILQEGDHHGGKLGPVGGTLVAGVIGRLLRDDPSSVWHRPDWVPTYAVNGKFALGHMVDRCEARWPSMPAEIRASLTSPKIHGGFVADLPRAAE